MQVYLRSLDLFSNAELLELWVDATPRAIFPSRRLGVLRVKQGRVAGIPN